MAGVGKKKFNVIHRTTSETIRLNEADILDETVHNIPSSFSSVRTNHQLLQHSRKKVQSSFQITDVCLTRPDIGEESADDLDESHTDDNSRFTDNETPSFSEDSKDAEEHVNVSTNQVSTAPTTSSTSKRSREKSRSLSSDSQNSNSFSRGRWTCLDYVDNHQQIIDMDIADNEKFVNQYLKSSSALKNCELFFEKKFQNVLQLDENGMSFNKDEVDDAYRKVAESLLTTDAETKTGDGKRTTIALDSKIEQAMDLVKRHLMYAVRQDVNVLKLKISELLVKISQLESENLYLRAKASPEVLKLLERENH